MPLQIGKTPIVLLLFPCSLPAPAFSRMAVTPKQFFAIRKERFLGSFAAAAVQQPIADRLNAKKVPSPAARKLQSGAKLSLHFRKSDEPPWSAKAVDRILHNEVYTGKLVQGKTRRLDYRSKKKMNVPMRDWVIVDNTHEAIIPAEQFELVRRILETETRRPNDAETVAPAPGLLSLSS